MANVQSSLNRLLAGLPKKEFRSLSARMESMPLIFGESIYEPGQAVERVFFPESGIISLLASVGRTSTLEVGIVGSEGLAGISVFLGVRKSPNRAIVQGAGHALTMAAKDFVAACKASESLSRAVRRYLHSLLTQISQSAACNRYHVIEDRLARWLLMTHDRMRSDEFLITQDFLSNMLGVRREAINIAAGGLQRQGVISYKRGTLTMIHRPGLEALACSCYELIRQDLDAV